MKVLPALAIALAALGIARGARELAHAGRRAQASYQPYAPSPDSAPIVALGYREVAADLLFARLSAYFGGGDNTAEGVADLVDAIVALDPGFRRIYEWGGRAITVAKRGVDQRAHLRALAVLEKGVEQFPSNWKIPYAAGQIYMLDLETDDPAQRRAWDERGAELMEAATRKPDAPAHAATSASFLRTRLGQHQRAIDGLREMLLITGDDSARQRILDELAKLENADASALAGEIQEQRRRFDSAWHRDRPSLSASFYVLLGPRPAPGFDMADLATGGRELIGSEPIEVLEPLEDPPATPDPPVAP